MGIILIRIQMSLYQLRKKKCRALVEIPGAIISEIPFVNRGTSNFVVA
jgi:hypothetical protein